MRHALLLSAAVFAACELPPAAPGERWWDVATPTPTPSIASAPTPTPGPSCTVDVFESEPAVPFDLLGLVEVQGRQPASDPESMLRSAQERACQLGGDALVVLFRGEGRRPGEERGGGRRAVLPQPDLRAAVIRYRR